MDRKTYEVVFDCVHDAFMECHKITPADRVDLSKTFQSGFINSGLHHLFSGKASKQSTREMINKWILPNLRQSKDPISKWMVNQGVDVMKDRIERVFN